MSSLKIIGHRGCAGLALENTLPSLELAHLMGVDAIEFDVRKTKDNHLVLCHDATTGRVSQKNVKIADTSLADLQDITLNDEQSHIPTLKEALRATGKTPLIIELKDGGTAELLAETLAGHNRDRIAVASFKHDELARVRERFPNMTLYALEHTKPAEIVSRAKSVKANGISLHYWLYNPLTYLLAKRAKFQMYAYTVDSRFMAWFIHLLYPQVAICTNHPEWFIKHPWLKISKERATSSRKRTRTSR